MILKIDSIATVSFNPSMSLANEYKCALNLSYTEQEASQQSLKKHNGGNSNKKKKELNMELLQNGSVSTRKEIRDP